MWIQYTPFTSLFSIQVSNGVFSSNSLHVEQTYTNIISWWEYCSQSVFSTNSLSIEKSNIKYLIWTFGAHCEHRCAKSVIKWERRKKFTPFTSILIIHDSKRVFSSTALQVEQTFTNIIIWRESCFQPVFSTNSL
jgi:hypothetical protein